MRLRSNTPLDSFVVKIISHCLLNIVQSRIYIFHIKLSQSKLSINMHLRSEESKKTTTTTVFFCVWLFWMCHNKMALLFFIVFMLCASKIVMLFCLFRFFSSLLMSLLSLFRMVHILFCSCLYKYVWLIVFFFFFNFSSVLLLDANTLMCCVCFAFVIV